MYLWDSDDWEDETPSNSLSIFVDNSSFYHFQEHSVNVFDHGLHQFQLISSHVEFLYEPIPEFLIQNHQYPNSLSLQNGTNFSTPDILVISDEACPISTSNDVAIMSRPDFASPSQTNVSVRMEFLNYHQGQSMGSHENNLLASAHTNKNTRKTCRTKGCSSTSRSSGRTAPVKSTPPPVSAEERQEKIYRYKSKKRNYGKKISYVCRKKQAEHRTRDERGRFN